MRRICQVFALCLLVSCKKYQTDEPPLPPSEMEAVVTDLELADAYALSAGIPAHDSARKAFREIVFKKHELTDEAYQDYLNWYYQHPAALDSVYTHVKVKLENLRDSF